MGWANCLLEWVGDGGIQLHVAKISFSKLVLKGKGLVKITKTPNMVAAHLFERNMKSDWHANEVTVQRELRSVQIATFNKVLYDRE